MRKKWHRSFVDDKYVDNIIGTRAYSWITNAIIICITITCHGTLCEKTICSTSSITTKWTHLIHDIVFLIFIAHYQKQKFENLQNNNRKKVYLMCRSESIGKRWIYQLLIAFYCSSDFNKLLLIWRYQH